METYAENAPPGGGQHYGVFAPAVETAPRLCRDFVGGVLESLRLPHLVETARLCTSELVTNVHRYAGGEVRLTVTVEPAHVQVAVYDCGRGLPVRRCAGVEETRGRGLLLVTALSDRCGMTAGEDGKGVWFRLGRG